MAQRIVTYNKALCLEEVWTVFLPGISDGAGVSAAMVKIVCTGFLTSFGCNGIFG